MNALASFGLTISSIQTAFAEAEQTNAASLVPNAVSLAEIQTEIQTEGIQANILHSSELKPM